MKKTIGLLLFVILGLNLIGQQDYYWYNNSKIMLTKNPNKKYIEFCDDVIDTVQIRNLLGINNAKMLSLKYSNVLKSIDCIEEGLTEKKWTIIELDNITERSFVNNNSVLYEAPTYILNQNEIGLSQLFYVKLHSSEDFQILSSLSTQNNVKILGNIKNKPLWFILECNKQSSGNSLEMANMFYETGLFASSEPDFIEIGNRLFTNDCVDDPMFEDQWGLENNEEGYTNIDINACEAWEISSGDPEIIIAVLDTGIELDHTDLPNVDYDLSFNTVTMTTPSVIDENSDNAYHGTSCAGIIGAAQNDIGVAGIAPGCTLMSISTDFNTLGLVSGFDWAVDHGADIINCSWGGVAENEILTESIIDALTYGRNGLGCIVIFASGNTNLSTLPYPASLVGLDDRIIVVGANDICGFRCTDSHLPDSQDGPCQPWAMGYGSNYGQGLSVVAPGALIRTTTLDDEYLNDFGGTSAAAPHVAGIAALLLSINSDLTNQEVKDIIEQSAQKIRTDVYTYQSGSPNGTWNEKVGYGMVNAYNAIMHLCSNESHILSNQNITWSEETVICDPLIVDGTLIIDAPVDFFDDNPEIIINDGGHLVIEDECELLTWINIPYNGSITVNSGGILELNSGSNLTLSEDGKLEILYNSVENGLLVFNQGASINLLDSNTQIDISGDFQIAANAQFTFDGDGYIKFSNPGNDYTENITCGSGASMLFQGSGQSDKVLEIQQNTVRFPDMTSLTFEDCKITMGANKRMLSTANYPITFDNVLLTSSAGTKNNHRSFYFFGQANTVINNSIFEFGIDGIKCDLTYYGSSLYISNSEFRNNTTGLNITNKGIHASFCSFHNNSNNGAYCYGMSLPSDFSNCEFHHNGHNGFTFYGSSTADLDVEACDIYSNIYDGIITSGAFDLWLSCNNIYSNRYGVYTQNGTYVYAENNAENDMHGNDRSIYLNYGRLFLNEGYNQLQAATDAYAVYGFSVEPGNCSASPQNIANNNRWEADDTEGPDYGTNYKLWKFQCSNPLVLVQLVDSIPDYTVCYHIDPDSLQEGGSCFQSNEETANLLNSLPLISLSGGISLPLDQAVTYLANQSDGVSSANAFNNLIDEYANLIFQCDNNTSDAVFLLKNKAYGDVHNTLTNYYEFIDYNSGHNGFNQAVDRMVLLHEDLLINPDIPDFLSIEYKLDIALLNYLRKDYNRSITQLEFLLNEIPDTVNAKAFVENWLCFVSAEKALREGTILPEEYEQSIAECNINYPVTIFDSPDHDEVQNANSTSEETAQVSIAINPNPNQGSFTVLVTNSSISGKIMITKATGQPVYETILTFAEQLVAVNGLPAGTFTVYYIENGTVITSVGTIVE